MKINNFPLRFVDKELGFLFQQTHKVETLIPMPWRREEELNTKMKTQPLPC